MEKTKKQSLENKYKTFDICMPVAGVPRYVGLSTHGLCAGTGAYQTGTGTVS